MRKSSFLCVLVFGNLAACGDGTPPLERLGFAVCESQAAAEPPSLTETLIIGCVPADAALDTTSNFDAFDVYFGGQRRVSQDGLAWSFQGDLALHDEQGWRERQDGGFTFATYEETASSVTWSGKSGSDTVRFELSSSAHPETQLHCARLAIGQTSYPLSCHVDTSLMARGRCSPFGFPGGSVVGHTTSFLVSFLDAPDQARVDAVMDEVRAASLVSEVTPLSSGGSWLYQVRFRENAGAAAIRAQLLMELCPLTEDLRIDDDAPLPPT